MTTQLKSIVPVWVLALAGLVVVLAASPRSDAIGWFPIVLAACVVATFGIQLALPRKTGFVDRVVASVCGALVLLTAATVILAAVGVAVR